MHEQFKAISEAMIKSGVSLNELAAITGIQKCTLNGWKSGKHKADALRLQVVTGYTKLLLKAVTLGELPLRTTPTQQKDRAWRVGTIRTLLANVRSK